jgi:hypothetical protein
MQLTDTAHDQEVGFRPRTRQVVDAAAADIECVGLPSCRKVVRAVDHHFALSRSALRSAPSKNRVQRRFPDLCMKRLHPDRTLYWSAVVASRLLRLTKLRVVEQGMMPSQWISFSSWLRKLRFEFTGYCDSPAARGSGISNP